jgi:hypothetical protein
MEATPMKRTWTIDITSDICVVGFNPEMADMDHPNGEILGEVFYLRATSAWGSRREFGGYDSLAAAEQALELGLVPPVWLDWAEGRPEYGSPAYSAYGEADDIARERRQADDEAYGFDTRFTRY